MQRFRDERPADICFARGTFNSHPYVMAAMNEFLDAPRRCPRCARSTTALDARWNAARRALNARLGGASSCRCGSRICLDLDRLLHAPSRYNWMFQYYLRAEGLALSWVGTGRLIFSHDYTDADFEAVADLRRGGAGDAATTAGGGGRSADQQVDQAPGPAGDDRRRAWLSGRAALGARGGPVGSTARRAARASGARRRA